MRTAFWLVFVLFGAIVQIAAQVSPRPVADAEMRDNNSLRMRSIQLERTKRDANKKPPPENSKEQIIKLAEIKDDFEGIQKLQDSIIRTYRTGKTIDYAKIGQAAANITKKARRLDVNLFGEPVEVKPDTDETPKLVTKSVRDLIIELDRAIGKFVDSPIFDSGKLVDSEVSARTEIDLQKVIKLSRDLSAAARRQS